MGLSSLSSLTEEDVRDEGSSPFLVVDCTLGYGGHSSHFLKALEERQTPATSSVLAPSAPELIAFDQDSVEIIKTETRLREGLAAGAGDGPAVCFTAVNQNFCTLKSYLDTTGQSGKVTSLLADLGLSSMQIDDNHPWIYVQKRRPA